MERGKSSGHPPPPFPEEEEEDSCCTAGAERQITSSPSFLSPSQTSVCFARVLAGAKRKVEQRHRKREARISGGELEEGPFSEKKSRGLKTIEALSPSARKITCSSSRDPQVFPRKEITGKTPPTNQPCIQIWNFLFQQFRKRIGGAVSRSQCCVPCCGCRDKSFSSGDKQQQQQHHVIKSGSNINGGGGVYVNGIVGSNSSSAGGYEDVGTGKVGISATASSAAPTPVPFQQQQQQQPLYQQQQQQNLQHLRVLPYSPSPVCSEVNVYGSGPPPPPPPTPPRRPRRGGPNSAKN